VQAVLELALSKYFGTSIKIVASGRTDTGVHARAQVCSFKLPKESKFFEEYESLANSPFKKGGGLCEAQDGGCFHTAIYRLTTAINAFLPQDASVCDFEIVPDTFHAQFSAKRKTYLYKIYVSPHRSALRDDFYMQIFKQPNVNSMRECAKTLVGRHNFKSFTCEATDSQGFKREIYALDIEEHDDELWFWVTGSGFMRNMVRILIGTLLEVGFSRLSGAEVADLLKNPDRTRAGKTLPAHGLTLYSVDY